MSPNRRFWKSPRTSPSRARSLFDLTGKVALITGASRGLGFAMAQGFARHGATVILNGRNAEALEASALRLRETGAAVHTSIFDVTNSEAIKAAVGKVEAEVGAIDILVNNAGIQHRQLMSELAEADWRRVIDTNLTGPLLVAQAVSPAMVRRKSGKIINICSLANEIGRPSIAPYMAAKGGLKMLTKSMALEWAKDNVQVNAIGPGFFKTEMNTPLVEDEAFNSWVCERTPAGRWGDPEELAGAAIFLASEAANYINGQIIYVDGGFLSSM
ncbi:MAG: SDR family oxidoreductase [Rhodospirillaceae bacterium]|nr:SDR family oxidoreductase [Rhodospirillaceae bacterium]MBT3626479.1 SDR family oxidoreductase [Rhodospirillaceae bacterium]MBT3927719.1 SDR family oxidoreductase [Rhodospirillaceae bacterium]MBT4425366.1 SDR family oxidoreductase [Rhodospirillaceae bacterium]MBT5037476.1 SDR family oxidoreductase [Rhodospirillaceae bacterium]